MTDPVGVFQVVCLGLVRESGVEISLENGNQIINDSSGDASLL
jgi:hypothetical protein